MTLHIIVPILSIVLAWCFLRHLIVKPARKRLAAARAAADMTNCLVKLNQGAFLSGHLQNGHYLHDKFYKFIFCAILHDNLLSHEHLSSLKYDREDEQKRLCLRREIDSLDAPTKEVVEQAILSIARKIWTDTPLLFLRLLMTNHRLRLDYEKSMVESAEYITIASPCHSY